MKRNMLITTICVAFVSLCITSAIILIPHSTKNDVAQSNDTVKLQADYYTFSSENDLINSCDLIIVGSVSSVDKNAKSEVFYDIAEDYIYKKELEATLKDYEPTTVSQIKVEEVLKGDLKEDMIQIAELGGTIDKKDFYVEGIRYLVKSDRCIFFLDKRVDNKYLSNAYNMLNPYQGYIKLDNSKVTLDKSNNLFTSGISESEIKEKIEQVLGASRVE